MIRIELSKKGEFSLSPREPTVVRSQPSRGLVGMIAGGDKARDQSHHKPCDTPMARRLDWTDSVEWLVD